MEKEKTDRINFLARKSRAEGLNEAEKAEQAKLREEYILELRASMTAILDNTYIQNENGERKKVKRKNNIQS